MKKVAIACEILACAYFVVMLDFVSLFDLGWLNKLNDMAQHFLLDYLKPSLFFLMICILVLLFYGFQHKGIDGLFLSQEYIDRISLKIGRLSEETRHKNENLCDRLNELRQEVVDFRIDSSKDMQNTLNFLSTSEIKIQNCCDSLKRASGAFYYQIMHITQQTSLSKLKDYPPLLKQYERTQKAASRHTKKVPLKIK